jgi:hypothetical protein
MEIKTLIYYNTPLQNRSKVGAPREHPRGTTRVGQHLIINSILGALGCELSKI